MEIPNHNSLLSAPILQPPQLHMHRLQYSHLQHPHQQEEIKDQHQQTDTKSVPYMVKTEFLVKDVATGSTQKAVFQQHSETIHERNHGFQRTGNQIY